MANKTYLYALNRDPQQRDDSFSILEGRWIIPIFWFALFDEDSMLSPEASWELAASIQEWLRDDGPDDGWRLMLTSIEKARQRMQARRPAFADTLRPQEMHLFDQWCSFVLARGEHLDLALDYTEFIDSFGAEGERTVALCLRALSAADQDVVLDLPRDASQIEIERWALQTILDYGGYAQSDPSDPDHYVLLSGYSDNEVLPWEDLSEETASDNAAFDAVKRQKFLREARAQEFDDDLVCGVQSARSNLDRHDLNDRALSSFAWSVASDSLDLIILRYTAGRPIADLATQLPFVVAAFDAFMPFDNPGPNEAHTLEITQLEPYVCVLWLLCLCKLLGHAELVPTVLSWIDKNAEFNRGRDGLFEFVVEKLTGSKVPVERVLLHPLAYRPLAKATVAENPEDRPALVKEFLDGWYKNMKPCDWHGTHTGQEDSSYFGYWAFEAALVTYLWNIDDSSYRDHLVYPKDLVAFARSREAASPQSQNQDPPKS